MVTVRAAFRCRMGVFPNNKNAYQSLRESASLAIWSMAESTFFASLQAYISNTVTYLSLLQERLREFTDVYADPYNAALGLGGCDKSSLSMTS